MHAIIKDRSVFNINVDIKNIIVFLKSRYLFSLYIPKIVNTVVVTVINPDWYAVYNAKAPTRRINIKFLLLSFLYIIEINIKQNIAPDRISSMMSGNVIKFEINK